VRRENESSCQDDGQTYGDRKIQEHESPMCTANGFACPTPPLIEAENVEPPKTIVTHRRLEVNPKASAAWMRRLSGHAVLSGDDQPES